MNVKWKDERMNWEKERSRNRSIYEETNEDEKVKEWQMPEKRNQTKKKLEEKEGKMNRGENERRGNEIEEK